MTLYLDTTVAGVNQARGDLYTLSGQSPYLGEINVPGIATATQITWIGQTGSISAAQKIINQRLYDLINGATPIVLHYVESSFKLGGQAITGAAAWTILDNNSNPAYVHIIVDYEMCSGQSYWVVGDAHPKIDMPRVIILYHEMSHAYRFMTGTQLAPQSAEESAAATDENVARGLFGLDLRKVADHTGGCGAAKSTWSLDSLCFIVTAVFGNYSERVLSQLRWQRDNVIRTTDIGFDFFESLYEEYYSYSPIIARIIARDDGLRKSVCDLLVTPLLKIYTWGSEIVVHEYNPVARRSAITEIATREKLCSTNVRDILPPDAESVLCQLTRNVNEIYFGNNENPNGSPDGFFAGLPLSTWAILRPIRYYYSLQRRLNSVSGDMQSLVQEIDSEILSWWEQRPSPKPTKSSTRGSAGGKANCCGSDY